jgi:hypothetical protein
MGTVEQHIAGPGMVVVEVTGADEDTVREGVGALEAVWATTGVSAVWRVPGEAGVRARTYAGPKA